MATGKLNVSVKGKRELLWEGEVWAVSSTNEVGPFDILPGHAQFVGIVKEYVLLRQAGREKKIVFNRALLQVLGEQVRVWVE